MSLQEADRFDRGLFYADGVFRTLLVINGEPQDLDDQMQVLRRDAHGLGLAAPDLAELIQQARQAAQKMDMGVLRMLCCRSNSGRGYAPGEPDCELLIRCSALPAYRSALWTSGARLEWSSVLLGIQPALAGFKHLARLEQVIASRNWAKGTDEVLMCDASGRVIGGSRSNVFFQIDGVLVTPDLSSAGVAGAMREKIIKIANRHGIEIEIGLISPDELRHATEGFMSNSLIGLWPIRQLGSLELPAPGPVTRRVQELLSHPWTGVSECAE